MQPEENVQLEIEEPLPLQVRETTSCWNNNRVCLSLRRFVTLDEIPHPKHHLPMFMIIISVMHVVVHVLLRRDVYWENASLAEILYFYIPCMRPTAMYIGSLMVTCGPSFEKTVNCSYDEKLRMKCTSFMYPHQLWRMVTCNLLHYQSFHLLATLFKQLFVGIPLERKYGSSRILLIYWLAELGASLSSSLLSRALSGVGASGALYGLTFFYIMDRFIALEKNANQRLIIILQLTILVIIPISIALVISTISKVSISHSAHIGGGLVGFLLGIGMLDSPCSLNDRYRLCQRTAFVFLSLYFLITMSFFFNMDAPLDASIVFQP